MTTRPETPSLTWPGAVLGTVIALGLLDQQVITPLIAALADGLRVGVAEVGLAISAYSVAAALAALVMGPLSDSRGRRPYLLLGATLMLASAGVISLAPHYATFVMARLAAGFAGGTIAALAVAWIADLVPYGRRGRVMSILMGGAMGAAILGQVGAAFAAGRFGHQVVYGAIAFLAAVTLAMLSALPEARPRETVSGSLGQKLASHLEFLKSPVHRTAAFAAFCMSGSLVGVSAYASGWLQEVRGFSLEAVGVLYGGLGAAIMAAQLLAGPLADRVGKRRFTLVVSGAVAAMTPVLPWLTSTPLVVAILVFGCLAVARIAAFTALRSELVPGTRRASFLGFSNVFSQIGIAAAVAAGGLLYPYRVRTGLLADGRSRRARGGPDRAGPGTGIRRGNGARTRMTPAGTRRPEGAPDSLRAGGSRAAGRPFPPHGGGGCCSRASRERGRRTSRTGRRPGTTDSPTGPSCSEARTECGLAGWLLRARHPGGCAAVLAHGPLPLAPRGTWTARHTWRRAGAMP